MQGLVNFTTAIADGIAVVLPTFCYLAACGCFMYFAWTLWKWSEPHARYQHHRIERPWAPFISLILSGVFASFPTFLTKANVSMGSSLVVGLTAYAPTAVPNASSVLGATPDASVVNVVTLFQHYFQSFGAACVFWAIIRWRGIIIGRLNGSPTACAVQFVFGIVLINIVMVASGIQALFNAAA